MEWVGHVCAARDCFHPRQSNLDERCDQCRLQSKQPFASTLYALRCDPADALWISACAPDRVAERIGAIQATCPLNITRLWYCDAPPKALDLVRWKFAPARIRSSWYRFGAFGTLEQLAHPDRRPVIGDTLSALHMDRTDYELSHG